MFPSCSPVSTLAAFAPLGPGAEPVPHLHRYYAAIRLPRCFGTPPVCPRPHLTRWASVGSVPGGYFPPRGRPSVRLQPTARRRGSPVLRRPDLPAGQSGVSQVTGPSSLSVPLATHPAGLPSTRLRASGNTAFQAKNPLSTGILCHFGADTGGPLTRLATLQPPPYEDDCKPGYQPAGYALAAWGSHPQDDSSEFQSIS
jgi:hypothetical protein